MICHITWEADIPEDIKAIAEPMLERWVWLVPTWCQEFTVRYDPMYDAQMAVTNNYRNRWAMLRMTGQWLGCPDSERELSLVHELIHVCLEPLVAPVSRIVGNLTKDGTKLRAMADKMFSDGLEAATQDLAHCFLKQKKEKELRPGPSKMRRGTRSYVGHVCGPCPGGDCPGWVDSGYALSETQIPQGIRWTGVECSACGKTFTIEQVEIEEEAPDG